MENTDQLNSVAADRTLYAHWALKVATVSFDLGYEGAPTAPANVNWTYGTLLTLPANPTRAGYTFTGWFDAHGVEVTSNSANDGSDLDLTAGWVGVGYEITLELNGGTGDNSTSWTYGQALAVEAPTLAGYTFNGWYTAATGGTLVTNTTTNDVIGERTLYARWNLTSNYFTVSYDRNGGESAAISDQNYTITGTISFPTAPTRTGYTFGGWYTAATAGTRVEAGAAASTTTLYAQWTAIANYYTVTYNANEGILTGSSTQDYTITGTLSFPTDPTREGYTFAGWYTAATAGTRVEAGAAASTTTLYAQWAEPTASFFVSMYTSETGMELWRTNGTTTELVQDINTGSSGADSSYPYDLTALGGYLYFNANDGTHGYELWRTNGTTTELVMDIRSGVDGSGPYDLTAIGGYLFFGANDGTHGYELWRTNGTTTELVMDILSGADGSYPSNLTAFGGYLYFQADNGTTGSELWRTNGTITQKF